MKRISILIKPASSLCNIHCRYCFYSDISSFRENPSYGKMSIELARKMIDQIYMDLKDGDELSLTFQGGEPTLVGLSFYELFIDYINQQDKKVIVSFSIQTNGMIINEKWCRFFKKNNFLVGLSMDGPAKYHNTNRVSCVSKGVPKGTYETVKKTQQLLIKHQVKYNILTVLTNEIAQIPDLIFDFIIQEKIKYIQFIPCLNGFSDDFKHNSSLKPEEYAFFYNRLLERWIDELNQGNYISIKLFDDLFNLLVNGQINACGLIGQCQLQYVIEANGNVYPCDFYVTDDYLMGNIQTSTLKELFGHPVQKKILCNKRIATDYCKKCLYKAVCGSGCQIMTNAICVNEKNNFCGHQKLLEDYIRCIPTLVNIF